MIYHVSSGAYYRDFVIGCCVMVAVAAVLAVYWLINWRKKANSPMVDVVLIGKFVFVAAAFVGTALFVVLYGTSIFWTMIYKVIITLCPYVFVEQ